MEQIGSYNKYLYPHSSPLTFVDKYDYGSILIEWVLILAICEFFAYKLRMWDVVSCTLTFVSFTYDISKSLF